MRRSSFKPQWSVTVLLLAANAIIYALQVINSAYFHFPVNRFFALSNHGLAQGYIWQLLTFQFLHGSIWHLLFNLLAIFFFGRMVEDRLGSSAALKIYLVSGTFGGLFQMLLGWIFPSHFAGYVLGASAGAFGLVAAATLLEPDNTILVSFIIPLKAKYFLALAAAISLFYLFVPNSQTAHAAHLGGILAGLFYTRWGTAVENFFLSSRLRSGRVYGRNARRGRTWQRTRSRKAADLPAEEFISREVDPILDKISAHGIQSLTPQEREILEAARVKMEHRGD